MEILGFFMEAKVGERVESGAWRVEWILAIFAGLVFFSCNEPPEELREPLVPADTLQVFPAPEPEEVVIDLDTLEWVDLAWLDSTLVFDLRYATENNFTGQTLYPCGRCLLRPAVARALLEVLEDLRSQGYGLKLFDCYRPHPVQEQLWEATPDRRYVTDPAKGSMHNRGAAVDLTLTDPEGRELDMGTGYDYFGREAWHSYEQLPDTILQRRKILKAALEAQGFSGIRTEWWHYSFRKKAFPVSDYQWPCKE
jgi:D-alanyl-D-alanine dipeptidase